MRRAFRRGYLPAEYRTPTADERRLLADAARILRPLRRARSLPKDDKLNAGLNGLALSAFSQAIQINPGQRDPIHRQRADRLQLFLLTRLVRDGRLIRDGARAGPPQAELEDYACVVQGLLDHADATGNGNRVPARQLRYRLAIVLSEQAGSKRALATCNLSLRWPTALYSPSDADSGQSAPQDR
jgi:uncharacterized protein YyaL (SSP411 family)